MEPLNGDPARAQQQQQPPPPPASQFPPPQPPAPATETLNPRPPIPAVGQQAAAGNKRKIDNGDFRDSIYFKIRTIVKDLRPHFVEVLRTSDFQKSKAAPEIKKQVKLILELSRQLRVGTSSPVKKHHADPRPTSKVSNPSNAAMETPISTSSTVPSEASETVKTSKPFAKIPDTKLAKIFEAKDIEQQLQGLSGTYVVGGSPLGWNFLVYTGSEPVYYGVTKAAFKSRLSCQASFGPASS